MRRRKTAFTSRISYAIGMQEGLFGRIEKKVCELLQGKDQPLNRRSISRATGIDICSLCAGLKKLVDAEVLEVLYRKDAETNRKVMHYRLNA